ncbi:MAG TPA: protein kinase [Phototrophicaceae bacterium]|nr:protein kinase [Phototrophicaceae bacterium]
MALYEGQMVGPYKIEGQIGQGGMATVYRAYHAKLDRRVAIKVMHQAFLQDPNFQSRFEREAQIVAKLEHSHIVPVYDYADHEGQPYLVMKNIEGQTLKSLLASGPVPPEQVLKIMGPIADALTYAHERGVLHRDIKPSNIVIDNSGIPYLTDFGLARIVQAGESTMSQDMILGTPHYISPEQARGERTLDARTDVYSFGVILYELIVGRVPFNADTPYAIVHDHIYTPLPMPRDLNPEVTPALERVLVKALAKDPAERYNSTVELMADFQQALAESGVQVINTGRGPAVAATPPPSQVSLPPLASSPRSEPAPRATPVAGERGRYVTIPAPIPPQPPVPPQPPKTKIEAQLDIGNMDWNDVGRKIEQGVKRGTGVIGEIARSIQEAVDENKKPISDEERIRRRLQKKYEERTGLFIHLTIYMVMQLVFWGMWAGDANLLQQFFTTGTLPLEALDFPWPIFITFFWGIGVFANIMDYYNKYGAGAERREQLVQQELERERQRKMGAYYDAKPKRDARMRLTADGELEEVPEDEYPDEQYSKPKRGRRDRW